MMLLITVAEWVLVTASFMWLKCATVDLHQQYIGCYRDNQSRIMGNAELYDDTNLTLSRCFQLCSKAAYFGLQNSTQCFCADKYDTLGPADNCNLTCSGNRSEICGGAWATSVYWVDTRRQYLGCYNEDQHGGRVMQNAMSDESLMTIAMCSQHCQTTTYMGLQFYSHCFCGEVYDTAGIASSYKECDAPCRGNASQICGASYRNSVFRVCPEGFYGPSCNLTCHCRDHPRYGLFCLRNGTCPAGSCANGWTGTVCDTDIDECSLSSRLCMHKCINVPGSYRCSCQPGYTLNADGWACDDIDECQQNNGSCAQVCTNFPGSYNCSCYNGYSLNTDGRSCDDIDECCLQTDTCSRTCINTLGSFTCLRPQAPSNDNCSEWPAGAKAAAIVLGCSTGLLIVTLIVVLVVCHRQKADLRRQLSETPGHTHKTAKPVYQTTSMDGDDEPSYDTVNPYST